eukprot:jgi/Psemu1/323076/estExt_fgenesh1_pg.C_560026
MYNHNLACDDCDSYHRRRPVSRPLGAPQPSSNAPGADKDEEFEQDEHTNRVRTGRTNANANANANANPIAYDESEPDVAGISRNDEDDDEDDEDETTTHTVFSSSAPSRAAVGGGGGGGGAVVAEVVDEAQLEAEFAERLKSRMVQATEIRSSETADKMAAHKRSSGGRGSNSNSKSKSSRNSRISHRSNKKETTREPSGAEDASPTKRKKLCFAGWFLALVVVFAIVLKVTLPTRVNKDDSLALNEDDSLVTGTNEVIDKGKNWWECPYEFTGGNSDNTLGENSKNPVSANSSSTQWPPSTENLEKENYLRHMVKQLSGLSFVAVKNNPQNLALQWMLADPYIFSGAIDNESNPASKLAERYALAVLYFSTSGESWFDGIGFLNYSSVCDWKTCSDCSDQKILHHSHYDVNNFQEDLPYIHKDGERNGVVCDANNQVIGLRLDHNNLIGTIPSELQVMGQMKSLSMSFNEGLSGTIPPELGELVKTSALKFARCSLKGTLPDSLRLLTELTLFSVYGNQLTGTLPESFLQVVAGLHNGDFGSNQFEGTIPNVFEPLSPLQNLYLDGNNFYGPIPSSIYFLTGLQILDVSNNNLEGSIAPQVSAMRDLRRFVLDENQFSGTLPVELAEMAYLEHFSASKNALSGTLPQDVLGMRKLAHLDLSFNNFTNSNQDPESVGELTSLVFLNLESNPYFGGYFPIGASGLKLSPLAEVRLKNTGIQGLEETMCEDASFPKNSIGMGIRIQANCLENGFVSCDCCTSCCESDGVDCVANTDEICHAHKNEFQTMWDEIIPQGRDEFLMECHCKDDDENLSGLYYTFCNNGYKGIDTDETEQIDTKHHICLRDNYDYTHYRTENAPEEKLICATNTNYGYTFDEGTGAEISFQNTIVYGGNSARWNGTSILFRSYSKGEGPYCAVWVDGEQCEECIHADCGGEDGGSNEGGFVISCRNLGSRNGSSHQGYTFDSCADNARSSKERQGKNGYLEIFHAAVDRSIVECYDDQSCSTGQLPIFLKFLQIAPERFRA